MCTDWWTACGHSSRSRNAGRGPTRRRPAPRRTTVNDRWSGWSALTNIVKADDTGGIGSGGTQGERRMHPVRQDPLAAPQRQWIHQQVELIDQVVREQGVDQL